ncbi:helix-turn-helix domain-containing protein [Saccharopolyspora hordei]|uniref:Transcriptional regulator with XRE-family HTH domain n=1 Tax=Saccharopolyspora hordei TaxID=1838 RepID=A0A853AD87_9PSEU|nr:helix-turn-helix transcriptional regulator [Saccharopolyspora hordei]NYI81868.1 transcriptional regulator with XRE-family HTH domain [Saccharopolyspora hordei]
MPATPTRRKKRLGQLLARLRSDASKSLGDASALLRVSEPTISRYETGHVRPGWAALQALLALYNATDEERLEAGALWDDAGERATQVITPSGSPKAFRAFLRAEAEAHSARTLEPHVVPGLLQTHAYARAVNESGQQFHTAEPARYVTARLSRQARLAPPSPLRFHALIDEAVLHRAVGGPEVMAEQLHYLDDCAARENVTIQILPFSMGAYGTMSGGFTIIDYADPEDPPAVYLDYVAGGVWVENVNDVHHFAEMFSEIASSALRTDESVELIRERAKALG